MDGLTPKQERFVLEYLVDLNATQAAMRAGYSKKTAQEQSSRLLSNVMVSEAIAKGMQALAKQTGVTAERVIAELALVGFANMGNYLNLKDPEYDS
jgi:phage terminase small subunit